MTPILPISTDDLLFDADALKKAGEEFHQRYDTAEPYPHIMLDNVFPADVLERVRQDTVTAQADRTFEAAHELNKSQTIPERLPFYARSFLYALNSRHFLAFLERMTGIKGLIPDPYYIGGGLHSTGTGGFLDIHADFNHHGPMDLERRLNVLIYLNPDWRPEFGGCLEIWDTAMTTKFEEIAPIFNRMVVFSTASDTMHGNPEPVNHPDGDPRRSLALYYYTSTWDEARKEHSTVFRKRPGTDDASDVGQRVERFVDDILPPIVNRQVKRVRRRLGF